MTKEPHMTTDDLYTGQGYIERNPTYHVEDSAWKAERICRMLRRNSLEPSSICEVGCGAGAILESLHARLPGTTTFEGYEISPEAHTLCQSRVADRLSYHLGDFTSLETPEFDLLLCMDVIEHVGDYMAFAKALKGRAEYVLFHIPVELSLYKVLLPGRLRKSTDEFGHIHFFTRDTAEHALETAGFEIADAFYTSIGADCRKTLEARIGRIPVKLVSLLSQGLAARLFGAHSLMVLAR